MKEFTTHELGEITNAIFRVLSYGIKLDFTDMKVNSETVEGVVMILRCTSTWKDYIPGYYECLNLCSIELTNCGVDKHDILFGLIDNNE